MKETYEFRVREKHAGKLFAQNEGVKLSQGEMFNELAFRKIQISPEDPRFLQIGVIHTALMQQGDYFFAGWSVRRFYTESEIDAAQVFVVSQIWTVSCAGEECGTQYETSTACPLCAAGARTKPPFCLNWKRFPKGKDIARTISGEIIVSRRLVELFEGRSITGVDFRPIHQRPSSSAISEDWFQLIVKSNESSIVVPTRVGIDPFNEDSQGDYRCPRGDTIGLARLSEIYLDCGGDLDLDVFGSRQFVGVRRGLLRPEQLLLLSPKVQKIIMEHKLKGCLLEVGHLSQVLP